MGMVYSESMSHTATEGPRRHRLTVADYFRMGEVGILAPDARVELIDGAVIDMAPPGSLHAGKVNRLVKLLAQTVGDNALLLVQNPIVLGEYSAPQPDLALARPQTDFYESRHPGPDDLILVVEVADTSRRFDREVKVGLYARHRIPEVWLFDLRAQRLERYREPREGAYTLVDRPDLRVAIELAALPVARVELSSLFP
jgi:Uma2 family endonuclease